MLSRLVTSTLTVLLVVVSLASSASADTLTFTDRRGDAPARYDLTRTRVTNGDTRVVVWQRVTNLRGGRSQIYGFNSFAGDDVTVVQTVRRKDGTVRNKVFDSAGRRVPCAVHARWRLGTNLIRISMPRHCITGRGAMRVSTFIGAGTGTAGDPADWTRTVRVRRG